MVNKERRRHTRCNQDSAIVFSIFNQTEQHTALARNLSRFGMYFESKKPLPLNSTLVIQPLDCDAASPAGSVFEDELVTRYCEDSEKTSETCRDLKWHVVAEVKHCANLNDKGRWRYGIGVQYLSPAV